MTNRIGSGTCNISLNVPLEEGKQLSKLAARLGQSLGDLVRRVTLKGLESELAATEAQIHREIGFVSKENEILLIRRAEALRQTVRGIRSAREKHYGAVMVFAAWLAPGAYLLRFFIP